MAKTDRLPLMMGGAVIGYMTIDMETYTFDGVMDSSVVDFLKDNVNLYEISFYGKPSLPWLSPEDKMFTFHERFNKMFTFHERFNKIIEDLAERQKGL